MSAALQGLHPAPGRLRRSLRLAGLCLVLAIVALFDASLMTTSETQRYTHDFDDSVARREPAVAAIFAADPALRDTMLRETKLAYDEGGWTAATARFQEMKRQLIQAYAGDDTTLACAAAWVQIARDLLPTPALCRAYLQGDYSDPELQRRMTISDAPCTRAVIDGGRRRAAGEHPKLMSDAEFDDAYKRGFDGPTPLSAEEKAAFLDPHADDRLICRASLKLEENYLNLPRGQAALYARTEISARREPVPLNAILPSAPSPASFHCAEAGTIFTLSMEQRDGRPITWTSLGQSGWDCRVRSSATSRQYLSEGNDRTNPIRMLWPLGVGKTADISGYTTNYATETHRFAVTSYLSYWLPIGWVKAYAIDDTASVGGQVRYIMTHYWSPDLGFKIGQRTQVKSGGWPDNTAPDWQLIALQPPLRPSPGSMNPRRKRRGFGGPARLPNLP